MGFFIFKQPYLIIWLSLIIIAILFIVRLRLKNTRIYPKITVGNAQILGTRREQEDSFGTFENNNYYLGVVADGMGGYSNGKLASSITVNTFINEFKSSLNLHPIENFFANTSNLSNRAVLDKGKRKKMGCTVVSVIISEGCFYWMSIGDSAIIHYKDGELININKKHIFKSVLEEKYISGMISEKQFLNDPMKKSIYSHIGLEVLKDVEMFEKPVRLRAGDKLVLCSDGVYNSLTEIELESILGKKGDPYTTAEEIVGTIKTKNLKNQDNATVIVFACT